MTSDRIAPALGKAIRRVRNGRGVSQEALALTAGIDRSYLGHIEAGRRNVGVDTVRPLAAALGLELSELLREAERIHAEGPDVEGSGKDGRKP